MSLDIQIYNSAYGKTHFLLVNLVGIRAILRCTGKVPTSRNNGSNFSYYF